MTVTGVVLQVVGGGTTINGMLYVRGDREDYDSWEKKGNTGWGWRGVLQYFKMSENQLNSNYARFLTAACPCQSTCSLPPAPYPLPPASCSCRDTEHHSVGGPLSVGDVAFKTPLSDAFLAAGRSRGFPIRDINRGNATAFTFMQVGACNIPSDLFLSSSFLVLQFLLPVEALLLIPQSAPVHCSLLLFFWLIQATIKNGKRQSTAESFLEPALRRGGLTVLTGSTLIISRLFGHLKICLL